MIERIVGFADWFREGNWPDALCPACGIGALRAGKVAEHDTTASQDARNHEAWEPEWIHGYFTCVLTCQSVKCREIALATGDWRVREAPDWDYDNFPTYESHYKLRMSVPPIPIMSVTKRCPGPVLEALDKASQVIWVDPSAAGNRLRLAIELTLNDKRIPRTSGTKRSRLTTHERIELLRFKYPDAAEHLEAVKWVGNQASHEDSLTVTEVLSAAQILEFALALMYDKTPNEIRRRTQAINKARRFPRSS